MKPFLIFISLAVLLISCADKTESINEPILIGSQDGVLASFGLSDIEDFINGIDSASRLLRISSEEINTEGASYMWNYEFVSTDTKNIYLIIYEIGGDCIAIGIDTTENDQDGASIITKSWIDSDLALDIAESNGGNNFRTENSNYQISILLSEAVVPNSFPIWSVRYYYLDKSLTFRINASNGNIYQTIYGI